MFHKFDHHRLHALLILAPVALPIGTASASIQYSGWADIHLTEPSFRPGRQSWSEQAFFDYRSKHDLMNAFAGELYGESNDPHWLIGVEVAIHGGFWPPDPDAASCLVLHRLVLANTPIGGATHDNWYADVILLRSQGGSSMYESTILGGLLAPAPLGNGPGDAYLGFCIDQYLQPTRYGWIHIANSASNPFDVHIIDWAYETTGAPILAGAIPTPGSAMLASAAAFIAFRRCRKVSRSYANLRPTTLLGHDFTVDSHGSPL